ncbi:MAG: type III-B CRISPR-associated protein Cas10/Cmr2 [Thermoanaerobaculia bacterium]|nr:MAG: type III-B CRISPR-associated protein Cas10/Cmr2 [Thermoanaerobaculia bacterium]MBZ0102127.1 type III-B CRISPR-associated protein Cas10/Cmr2 [Thermoanaerobaculia bacterium]
MTAHLLLFSIGPVQDFIATARKGQDLWFGSWLLSELARTAAQAAQDQGAELIMPARISLQRQEAVANKIAARVTSKDAVALATAVEAAARQKLADLAKSVFDRIAAAPSEGRHLHRDNADAQVADLPEITWVVVDEVPGDWGETRRRAEAALAARKSLRDFGPVTWGAPVPKSRLDGQRESVIDEAAFPKANQNGRAERLRQSFGVGPAERLCGVGLLKRNGRHAVAAQQARGARVISTSHVASWSIRRAWSELSAAHSDIKLAFDHFIEALPGKDSLSRVPQGYEDPVLGRFDGAVLFAGRLAEDYEGDQLVTARAALKDFLGKARSIVEGHGGRWPHLSPYFAVVRADGDHMGAWLDGMSTPADHQNASAALAGFAASAESVVARHHGHCVFAGGDDVLALLPVATALDCAAALNDAFTKAIADGPKGSGAAPTLSVGIRISHATDPFRESLEGAREAEYAAKHTYGRAAFAVCLDKRSGAPVLVGGKWDELPSFRALQNAQDPDAGSLPRGLAYDLRHLAERLAGEDSALSPIRALEVDRVLDQKNVGNDATRTLWARLGDRDLSVARLTRVCDEMIATRALAALDGGDS